VQVTKRIIETEAVIPVMAALPYAIAISDPEMENPFNYNPQTQLTRFAGRRDYCTCRVYESAGGYFSSKSDTKKDD
jgi:hypothetical protein